MTEEHKAALEMLRRLAEKVHIINAMQHAGYKLQPEYWSELYVLTLEAFGLLEIQQKGDAQ